MPCHPVYLPLSKHKTLQEALWTKVSAEGRTSRGSVLSKSGRKGGKGILSEKRAKTIELDGVWKDFRRNDLLRLKRSALGTKIFGVWQRKIISGAFQGWQRYFLWRRGMQEAFKVIKHLRIYVLVLCY